MHQGHTQPRARQMRYGHQVKPCQLLISMQDGPGSWHSQLPGRDIGLTDLGLPKQIPGSMPAEPGCSKSLLLCTDMSTQTPAGPLLCRGAAHHFSAMQRLVVRPSTMPNSPCL